MRQLSKNQSLLFKACFINNSDDYFKLWQEHYTVNDLDYYTRALLPLLLNSIDVETLSPKLNQQMMSYKHQTWLFNTLKFHQLKVILDDLSTLGVECCLLKGAAMMLYYYNDVSQRPERSDIDLLIKRDDIPKAMAVLKKHGFSAQHSSMWTPKRLENSILQGGVALDVLHAIHYRKDKILIDLHWDICPFIKKIGFEELKPFMHSHKHKLNNTIFCMNHEMQLIHIAIHAAFNDHFSPSLVNAIDFCFLINQQPDFNRLALLASEHKALGYIRHMMKSYKSYIKENIYLEYERAFSPYKVLGGNYMISRLFSTSLVQRRIGQIFCLLQVKRFNPFALLKHMKNFFGATTWKQFFNLIYSRFLTQGR
jgi:hypothetical protein